jgi:peroxiredoxin
MTEFPAHTDWNRVLKQCAALLRKIPAPQQDRDDALADVVRDTLHSCAETNTFSGEQHLCMYLTRAARCKLIDSYRRRNYLTVHTTSRPGLFTSSIMMFDILMKTPSNRFAILSLLIHVCACSFAVANDATDIYNKCVTACKKLSSGEITLRGRQAAFQSKDTIHSRLILSYRRHNVKDSSLVGLIRTEEYSQNAAIPSFVSIYDGESTLVYATGSKDVTLYGPPRAKDMIRRQEIAGLPFIFGANTPSLLQFDEILTETNNGQQVFKLVSTKRNIKSGPIPVDSVKTIFWIDGDTFYPVRLSTVIWMLGEVQFTETEVLSVKTTPVTSKRITRRPPGSFTYRTAGSPNIGALAPNDPFKDPIVGDPAPDFEMTDILDSSVTKLSQLRGKHVLLTFWQMSCSFCLLSSKHLQSIREKYARNQLEILAVDQIDERSILSRYVRKLGYTFTVHTASANAVRPYHVTGYPRFFLIDPEGKIQYVGMGYSEGLRELHSSVDKALRAP